MTGSRRSSRHQAEPEKDNPNHAEEHSKRKSQLEDGNTGGEAQSAVKKPKKELIADVRRNLLDDGLEFYHKHADKWIPGSDTPPELLKVWAKKQMRRSTRRNLDPNSGLEVNGVKRDPTIGLVVNCKKEVRSKAATPQVFRWVPVHAVSSKAITAWAKVEKECVEEKVKHLQEHEVPSNTANHLLLLEDLLDGEIMQPTKPDSSSDSAVEDQDVKIPSHPPHYPLPTTFDGDCDNTTQPSSILAHTNLVAACQASKHLPNGPSPDPSPHLVCTACHDNPPTQRLTQHERDHIIRDQGLFPLCTSCTHTWCKHHGVDSKEMSNNCTCNIQLPQWLCADCWVEMARARSRRADGCVECSDLRTEREKKGEGVIREGVHMCSGCQALVVKQSQTPTA